MSIAIPDIRQQLLKLNKQMVDTEASGKEVLQAVHPAQYTSAVNLLHYLALRNNDIRPLQRCLHESGLSSLSNSEGYVRSQVLSVLDRIGHHEEAAACTLETAQRILEDRTMGLFGKGSDDPIPAIMVTFKANYSFDHSAVKKLLKAGMQVARINCAHDNEDSWLKMIRIVQRASEGTGRPCKIYMDLAGPKIRTVIRNKKKRIEVEEDDMILMTDEEKLRTRLPVVHCTIPGITSQLKTGERVFFDDGLIESTVTSIQPGGVELKINRVATRKPFLKEEKGINFPDSQLSLRALTAYDRKCLPFILEHADMVGYSFVHNTPDLELLRMAMKQRKIPVILKIETPEAFNNLPDLLFSAMRDESYGVMIARGDLAVEMGFERMTRVQDEISWMCEAAHAPVIQATQFLENLNKQGIPTRAEITDASNGFRADCVMINKGTHMVQVIRSFRNILEQMGTYNLKKRYFFRPLPQATSFLTRTGKWPGLPVPDKENSR